MHEPTVRSRACEPIVPDTPVRELAPQLGVTFRVAVTGRRSPFLCVDDVGTCQGIAPISCFAYRAAGVRSGPAGLVHDFRWEGEAIRPEHYHFHSAHRSHV